MRTSSSTPLYCPIQSDPPLLYESLHWSLFMSSAQQSQEFPWSLTHSDSWVCSDQTSSVVKLRFSSISCCYFDGSLRIEKTHPRLLPWDLYKNIRIWRKVYCFQLGMRAWERLWSWLRSCSHSCRRSWENATYSGWCYFCYCSMHSGLDLKSSHSSDDSINLAVFLWWASCFSSCH